MEADLVSLGGLPEAQVEVLPEEFHWHVDETPLEAASGYTVPEEDTEEHRRLFDLSFDVKNLYLAPGTALYKQHRLPHMVKQAWYRLLQKIRQIFDSFVRNQVRPREGATARAAVARRSFAARAFTDVSGRAPTFELRSVELVLSHLSRSGKIELFYAKVDELRHHSAHVVNFREGDDPRLTDVWPRGVENLPCHRWPFDRMAWHQGSTAQHTFVDLPDGGGSRVQCADCGDPLRADGRP